MEANQLNIILQQNYHLQGEVKALPGEEDLNYLLKLPDSTKYVCKFSKMDALDRCRLEQDVMEHLHIKNFPYAIPKLVRGTDGEKLVHKENHLFRVQSFVPGRRLDQVNPRTADLLHQWGQLCGELSKALQDFEHASAHRRYKWNPSDTLMSREHIHLFSEEEKEIASYFWKLFEAKAVSILPSLRKSINYNDAHDQNIFVSRDKLNPRINGLIDFGDVLYCETINELAIACAYAGMHKKNPIAAISHLVSGYHEIFPITEKELEVLFHLITARLLITVASSAHNKHKHPENAYLQVSEKPAWDVLKKLFLISPDFAHYSFRHACGLTPHPKASAFKNWLANNATQFTPIVDLSDDSILEMDLSVGSLDLGHHSNFKHVATFNRTVNRLLEDHDASAGIGGYAEARVIYTTDRYQVSGDEGSQWRTVHLGLDVWKPAGTAVFAAIDGEIFSAVDHDIEGDYGPTIILKHETETGLVFYTLYGHLSRSSIASLNKGDKIKKGQHIAFFGDTEENGHWPPHLHFQILLNLFGNTDNFPGVAFPHEAGIYLSNGPDPSCFFPQVNQGEEKSSLDDILADRQKYLGKGLSISYKDPLHIVRGSMQYLFDIHGQRFLDTVNNVAHVGHEHPHVVQVAAKQNAVLNTNTRYAHAQITAYAEELLSTFPSDLCKVFFVNSGSEANELALRMLHAHTGSKDIIAMESGYHGNTSGTVDISSYKFDGKGGLGAPEHCHIAPSPDAFRGLYQGQKDQGVLYANHIEEIIDRLHKEDKKLSGFICESILSCGGQIVLPDHYLKNAYDHVRKAGGLCIADEVQVGFGRVGKTFWGFELYNVVPDIVTLGKPIGNGHPLAAVVTTEAVANSFNNGMEYFNTFGGNPVSCAVGRAVLSVIKNENLQQNALQIGNYMTEKLIGLQERFSIIGDVRGHGLFLGFELVSEDQAPAAAQTSYLANRMRHRGILMSVDGPLHNVIKIKPPMCFSKADADFLIENLVSVLTEDYMQVH